MKTHSFFIISLATTWISALLLSLSCNLKWRASFCDPTGTKQNGHIFSEIWEYFSDKMSMLIAYLSFCMSWLGHGNKIVSYVIFEQFTFTLWLYSESGSHWHEICYYNNYETFKFPTFAQTKVKLVKTWDEEIVNVWNMKLKFLFHKNMVWKRKILWISNSLSPTMHGSLSAIIPL